MTAQPSATAEMPSVALVPETRIKWLPIEPVPEGWASGNQCFVDDYLDVFFFDPKVPYRERKDDGSTDRWIKHRKITERRYVSAWEAVSE